MDIELMSEEEKKLDKLVLDICYDRSECRKLGIDYNNVTYHDMQRIKYLIRAGLYQ